MTESFSNAGQRSLALPIALIRLSSVLFLFLTAGHMSAYPWSSAGSPQQARLASSMKSTDFTFMGERSTYWNLYFGWGLLVGVLLFTIATMLWLLSNLARLAPRRVGAMTGLIAMISMIGAWLSFRFFYVPPMLSFAASCVVLLVATVRLLSAAGRSGPAYS